MDAAWSCSALIMYLNRAACIAGADLSAGTADYPHCESVIQAKRVADGKDLLANQESC